MMSGYVSELSVLYVHGWTAHTLKEESTDCYNSPHTLKIVPVCLPQG